LKSRRTCFAAAFVILCMRLFTDVSFPRVDQPITYESSLLFLGSCFAEEIGNSLADLRFDVAVNPLGITYNPLSLAWQLNRAIEKLPLDESELVERDGLYFHPQFHSKYCAHSMGSFLEMGNRCLDLLYHRLVSSDYIYLTLGTTIAYLYGEGGEAVNNCHKLPANLFRKSFLDEHTMYDSLRTALQKVRRVNPKCKIVFTVSPIRHLRHGAVENQRSKARLIRLVERLESREERIFYLPVYELVMDELRDYRFYRQDDLIHLNEAGLEIIRNRFFGAFCDKSTLGLMEEVKKWLKAANHRIMNTNSIEHQKFRAKFKAMTDRLEERLPGRFRTG
jgi:hypothetical protein